MPPICTSQNFRQGFCCSHDTRAGGGLSCGFDCMGLIQNPPARHLPAPLKKPYIYKKTLVTVVTVVTAPASPVVIGFVGNHTQIFTWLPLVTALPFRA